MILTIRAIAVETSRINPATSCLKDDRIDRRRVLFEQARSNVFSITVRS